MPTAMDDVDAGDLRDRVKIERDTITRVNGAEVRTPSIYATAWASVVHLSGSEAWQAHQIDASINVRVTLRYRTDINSADRVIYRGKRMEIVSPPELDEERRKSVKLWCRL